MITDDLRLKLSQIEVAIKFYDELGNKLIKNDIDLENTQLKMDFTRKEILKIIIENKEMIEDVSRSLEKP